MKQEKYLSKSEDLRFFNFVSQKKKIKQGDTFMKE